MFKSCVGKGGGVLSEGVPFYPPPTNLCKIEEINESRWRQETQGKDRMVRKRLLHDAF